MTTSSYIEDTILKAKCSHCGAVNAFPEFRKVDAFVCCQCDESVEVEEKAGKE